MTDQEKIKKAQPAIGGIGRQYATIGGGKRTPENLDVQTSERPSVEASEQPDIQDTRRLTVQTTKRSDDTTSKRSSIQTSERSDAQTSDTSTTQKKEKNERSRQTVYLEPDVDDWIRDRIKDERKRLKRRVEISEVVNDAIRYYRENKPT